MSRIDLIIGLANVFALPLAVCINRDENWGSSSVVLIVGPFIVGLEWWPA